MEKAEEMFLAAKEGSEEAFEWLYRETYSRNYYIVLKMVKQEQDAMDILQDAYVKIFQNLPSFHYTGSQSFISWTGKIASNTALDFLRKKRPILFSDLQADGADGGLEIEWADESVENQPELVLDQKETAQIVQKMLECLSEEQRICVVFRYLRQMKISEIARECGCSENTVKSRLNYAKKRLSGEREALEKKGIRLYNVAPFTLLVFLLEEDAKAACVPMEVTEASASIFQQAFGGQDAVSLFQKGKISAGAKTAAGHGAGKIAAVAAASLFLAGAGTFLLHFPTGENMDGRMTETEVAAGTGRITETEETESFEIAEETIPATKTVLNERPEGSLEEEEIYYEYLNHVLIPEYGLADLQQDSQITMYFDDQSSRISEENEWFEPKGIVSAYIDDLDFDGQKELFVIYWEKEVTEGEYNTFYDMTGAVYEIEGEKVVYQDKMRLSNGEHDWEKYRESMGNFSVAVMKAEGRKYLLVYKGHLVWGAFSDGSTDRAMWTAEYKDGKVTMVQEMRIAEAEHDHGGIPYVGITYEGGKEKTEILYAGWAQPEKGPYPTLKEAFVSFFQRKGLDVSEFVENVENLGNEHLEELTHTEDAALICTLNSMSSDYEMDDLKQSLHMIFEGKDETHLREHVKEVKTQKD